MLSHKLQHFTAVGEHAVVKLHMHSAGWFECGTSLDFSWSIIRNKDS